MQKEEERFLNLSFLKLELYTKEGMILVRRYLKQQRWDPSLLGVFLYFPKQLFNVDITSARRTN